MPTLVCALFAVVLASPPADVRQRAREIVGKEYQRELPHREGGSADVFDADGRRADSRNRMPATPRRRGMRGGEGGFVALGSIAQMMLWALTAAGLALCAFWLARELSGYSADVGGTIGRPRHDRAAEPDRAVVERPLGDADELARRGLFGEAVHVLLLRTLQELARRLPDRLSPSLTSREILARVRIPDEARRALAALVGAVEVSHFGGVQPGESDFLHCREHFQRFAEAYLRGAA